MRTWIAQLGIVLTLMALPLVAMGHGASNDLMAQVQLSEEIKPEFAVSITAPEGSDRSAVGNIVMQMIAGSLIFVAGPLAVMMLAWGGLRYVTSHGDQNQMEEAKKTITWAIIGLVVIILSFAIVTSVINILAATDAPDS